MTTQRAGSELLQPLAPCLTPMTRTLLSSGTAPSFVPGTSRDAVFHPGNLVKWQG